MYWGSKVPEAACLMLVQRYDDDVLCDVSWIGSKNDDDRSGDFV